MKFKKIKISNISSCNEINFPKFETCVKTLQIELMRRYCSLSVAMKSINPKVLLGNTNGIIFKEVYKVIGVHRSINEI